MGRYQLVFELAQSYLGPLWAVCTDSDASSGLAMLRLVTLSRLDADTRVRLLEAAWQAMEVRCEGVCPVTDVVASDGELGVVSEYIEGLPLRALQGLAGARRKPITPAIALKLLSDIATAASALHAVARDVGDESTPLWGGLSPDSIHVTTDGRALLLDPAVAGVAAAVPSLGGNPERAAYSSPEQLTHEPRADARSDVFTLGIIAWELLSNRRLFIGSDKAVAQKVISGKIPRLDEVKRKEDPEIPAPMIAAITRALERDPAARFQSPEEFREALHASPLVPCDAAVVAEYVQGVADGALGRLREALKDESTGTRAGASVAKASNVAARASAADLTAAVAKSDPLAARASPTKAEGKAIPAIRIEGPRAFPKPGGGDLAGKLPAPATPPDRSANVPAPGEARTAERSSPLSAASPPDRQEKASPVAAQGPGNQPAAPRAPAPKRAATIIGIMSPLAAGPRLAAETPAPNAPLPKPPGPPAAPATIVEAPLPFLDDAEPVPAAVTPPARPMAAHEDLSSLDGDDEPTGQFTARDLLKHVEQMARKSDPARRVTPEPAMASAKTNAAEPESSRKEDIDWLDEPESKAPAELTSQASPKGTSLPGPEPKGAFPGSVRLPEPSTQNTVKPPPPAAMPKAALVSTPPPAYYPSQIPPPLIHDPRANLGPAAAPARASQARPKKKEKRGSRVVLGILLSAFLVAGSAVVAVLVLRSRGAPADTGVAPTRGSVVLAASAGTETGAAPEPVTAPLASAVAGSSPGASPAGDSGSPPAPDAAGQAKATSAAGTTARAAASAPAPTTKATTAKAPAPATKTATAKTTTGKAPAPTKRKSKRFVPNDI